MLLASTAVFLLSGLWHGANWTFVAWGALHAAYYVAETLLLGRSVTLRGWRAAISVLLTFAAVSFSWVLFRAADMAHAADLYRALFSPWQAAQGLAQTGLNGMAALHMAAVIPASLLLSRWGHGAVSADQRILDRDTAVSAFLVLIIALCWLDGLGSNAQNVFIYFQF